VAWSGFIRASALVPKLMVRGLFLSESLKRSTRKYDTLSLVPGFDGDGVVDGWHVTFDCRNDAQGPSASHFGIGGALFAALPQRDPS
jgi:hypothetical protein